MKQKKITGAVVVVLVIAAGLWWFLQPAPVPALVAKTFSTFSPEHQRPIDPKSPALHPPPSAPFVPPPAQPHSSQPPNPATAPPASVAYSISELKTAFADIARLIRAGDMVTFIQTYSPPDELAKMDPQNIQDMQQGQAQQVYNSRIQQMKEDLAQTFVSFANQTPTFNAAGDEATYTFIFPPNADQSPGSMVFVKINSKWYLKDFPWP